MKWSWKAFSMQLGLAFVVAIVMTFLASLTIESKPPADGPDQTTLAMAFGGILSAILLAGISGWRFWNLRILLVVAPLVSGLFSGNPSVAILTIPMVAVIYFSVSKLRNLFFYYSTSPGETTTEEESS